MENIISRDSREASKISYIIKLLPSSAADLGPRTGSHLLKKVQRDINMADVRTHATITKGSISNQSQNFRLQNMSLDGSQTLIRLIFGELHVNMSKLKYSNIDFCHFKYSPFNSSLKLGRSCLLPASVSCVK